MRSTEQSVEQQIKEAEEQLVLHYVRRFSSLWEQYLVEYNGPHLNQRLSVPSESSELDWIDWVLFVWSLSLVALIYANMPDKEEEEQEHDWDNGTGSVPKPTTARALPERNPNPHKGRKNSHR